MLYLAWHREINISLFFCDVFVWKWGPRPRTSSRCYHGNKNAAAFKKGIFVHPRWVPNCMQNLNGGWKFLFPKMFDSYRDLFLTVRSSWNHDCKQLCNLMLLKSNYHHKISEFRPMKERADLGGDFQHSDTLLLNIFRQPIVCISTMHVSP